MKALLLFLAVIVFSSAVMAQQVPVRRPGAVPAPAPKPLPTRQVSSVVKDSTDNPVIGATVSLISQHDTLKVSTNADGVFVFKAVKSPEFTITVKSLGFQDFVRKYYYPYTNARLTLDPVLLKSSSIVMKAIELNGNPAITYKTDTVEYRASDYKVRENATMEDLLKKMEGIEVDKDGNVTAQGIAVTGARVNGRRVAGADVAGLIRDLPAEIAEKVQVIDDYGDQAELTGIKDGEPQKILNIVTRRDKSVSNSANLAATRGNNARTTINASGRRQNANQQIMLRSTLNKTVTGVAGSNGIGNGNGVGGGGGGAGGGGNFGGGGGGGAGGGGGNPGTSQRGSAGFSYADDLGKKIALTGGYTFNGNTSSTLTNSNSIRYQTTRGNTNIDTIYSTRGGLSGSDGNGHSMEARLTYKINAKTTWIVNPTFNINSSASVSENRNNQTGDRIQDQTSNSTSSSRTPTFSVTSNFAHRVSSSTNVSLQINLSNSGTYSDRNAYNRLLSYNPASIAHELLKDSLAQQLINTDNVNASYRASTTLTQALGTRSRLEFNGQIDYRGYDNSKVTNDITNNGPPVQIDRLSKIFDYSFTQTRLALNYRRGNNSTKVNFSLGLTAVPGLLKGTSETLKTTTERRSFNLIPITRVEYKWSNQKLFSLNYSGTAREPSFDQIQDVPDETNVNNVIIGNPGLKASFSHAITASFRNYLQKPRITIQTNLTSNFVENQVISTRTQVANKETGIDYNVTQFINKSGNHNYSGSYNFSKRFPENTYAIKLDGNVRDNYSISMYNGNENIRTSWQLQERLTLQITPKDWLEINPFVSHEFSKSNNTLPQYNDTRMKNWAMNLDGRFIIKKRIIFGYDLSKNFVSGLNANTTSNPFIINSYITKEFFKRKNGTIRLSSFDLLNQNNFINRQVSDNGITETQTNRNSRYFTLGLTWRPSKYSGGGQGSRTAAPRRGDGSFIVN